MCLYLSLPPQAQAQVDEWQGKMGGVEEFMKKKEELELEVGSLRVEIENKSKEAEREVLNLERGFIQQKEKWRKETSNKIKQVRCGGTTAARAEPGHAAAATGSRCLFLVGGGVAPPLCCCFLLVVGVWGDMRHAPQSHLFVVQTIG